MSTITINHARIKRIGVGKISKTFAFEILNEDLTQENLQALEQLYRDGETCALGVIVLEEPSTEELEEVVYGHVEPIVSVPFTGQGQQVQFSSGDQTNTRNLVSTDTTSHSPIIGDEING